MHREKILTHIGARTAGHVEHNPANKGVYHTSHFVKHTMYVSLVRCWPDNFHRLRWALQPCWWTDSKALLPVPTICERRTNEKCDINRNPATTAIKQRWRHYSNVDISLCGCCRRRLKGMTLPMTFFACMTHKVLAPKDPYGGLAEGCSLKYMFTNSSAQRIPSVTSCSSKRDKSCQADDHNGAACIQTRIKSYKQSEQHRTWEVFLPWSQFLVA